MGRGVHQTVWTIHVDYQTQARTLKDSAALVPHHHRFQWREVGRKPRLIQAMIS